MLHAEKGRGLVREVTCMIFMWKGGGRVIILRGLVICLQGALYITIASYIFMRNHLKFYSAPTGSRPSIADFTFEPFFARDFANQALPLFCVQH